MIEKTLVVPSGEMNLRLDVFISLCCPELTRSHLKNSLSKLTVNDLPSKLSKKIKAGDVVFFAWEEPKPHDLVSQDIPLEIIYEDENVTVVNKPQCLVVHPAAGNWDNTLVNALLFHWKTSLNALQKVDDSKTNLRPGIVHRLDKDTSGLIITARNYESEAWLQKQFFMRRVKKEYIAILCGVPKNLSGEIKINLIRDSKNRQRFTWSDSLDKGKFSHTIYKVTKIYGNYCLVKLKLKTGRTHQLRVHMKYLGCPILGDPIYGKKDLNFPNSTLMLHSKNLGVFLPQKTEMSFFTSEIPLRFKKIILCLRKLFSDASE